MRQNDKIIINCTSEEKDKVQRKAKEIGLTLQEYVLKCCLNAKIMIQIEAR